MKKEKKRTCEGKGLEKDPKGPEKKMKDQRRT